MDDVLTLIKIESTQDIYGQDIETETSADVICEKKSIGQKEFFEAGRNGFKPECVFKIHSHEYDGEKVVEFNGVRYGVYRTYQPNMDDIELYVELKGGVYES